MNNYALFCCGSDICSGRKLKNFLRQQCVIISCQIVTEMVVGGCFSEFQHMQKVQQNTSSCTLPG